MLSLAVGNLPLSPTPSPPVNDESAGGRHVAANG